jgi:glycine/D-amino acid oxidase-like deaminating enzyme
MQPLKELSSFQDSKGPDSNPKVVIVGAGLAGSILARTLEQTGASIQIWDIPCTGSASRVAAGIWCPINFHRLIPGWRAEEAIGKMLAFYANEERILGKKFLHHTPYWIPITDDAQGIHWRKKALEYPEWLELREGDEDSVGLNRLCHHWEVMAWGVVKASGWLDVEGYLQACRENWILKGCIQEQHFSLDALQADSSTMVVDARGYYAWQDPWHVDSSPGVCPLQSTERSVASMRPAQGELVEFELQGWPENIMIKKEWFIQPLGDHRFRAGATFEWSRLSPVPTEEGKERLQADLQRMLGPWWARVSNLQYKAGIRPSSHDRRPYAGADPFGSNRFVFNGFGAKGVLLAPMVAEELANAMLYGKPLHPEAQTG